MIILKFLKIDNEKTSFFLIKKVSLQCKEIYSSVAQSVRASDCLIIGSLVRVQLEEQEKK